jgi:tRNA-dihydrouridine synthase B
VKLTGLWQEHNFPFTLAPMVGLSHAALRRVIQDYMPEGSVTQWPTEMLNSRRLPGQTLGETPETKKSPLDNLLVPQILGNERKYIEPSIEKLKVWGARGIDINMGCPVKKALKHNYGVALMGDPDYAAEVVRIAVSSSDLPVSVKLRVGLSKDDSHFLKFNEKLIDAGASLLCLHPRTAEQKRKGSADWNQIKLLKQHLPSIPIYGNGDVQIYSDALRMIEQTGCDGVMIGRALTARPWMMWQLGESLGLKAPSGMEDRKCPYSSQDEAYEYGRVLRSFITYCFEYYPSDNAKRKINFYLKVSSVWLNFGHILSKKLFACNEVFEYHKVIDEFFAKPGLSLAPSTMLSY